MLELKNIKKSYIVGETIQEVLKGIDIKFRKNEFASILGSSGSGKTTLLNIIGGLDKYDDGDLIIDEISTHEFKDRDWDSYRNYRVGFIFQSYNLIMHQSVLQNVELALTLSGISKTERTRRAIGVLEKVGLKDHVYKKPNQLSGGQMQRVAIARALVNNPEIILADEPTGALDSITSIQIMDLLKDISKDKLVIMVTHNPEIAKKYSTRIIELKDGLIINDSNPVKNKEKDNNETRKVTRTSMSLLSALSLSFNNLLTKKGRTFLTAFAGSIGIIGIALILALSNGVNNYAKKLERESLSDYPLKIEKTSYDLLGTLSAAFSMIGEKEECEKDKVCSIDDIVRVSAITDEGVLKKNNTKAFKKYLESTKEFEELVTRIEYDYGITPQIYTNDYEKVNPSNLGVNSDEKNLFKEIDPQEKKYELLAGSLPSNESEIVLVVNNDNQINDTILYSLGIKDKKILLEDISKVKKDNKYRVENSSFSYDKLLNFTYKLILNTDYYELENDIYIDHSNDQKFMKNKIDNGMTIKVVGIIKDTEDADSFVGYTKQLTEKVIEMNSQTEIYKAQINNQSINVLTGEEFDDFLNTYEDVVSKLAIYELDDPSSISIYPKDYKSKEKIEELITKYNDDNKFTDLEITYSDIMKGVVGGITKVVDIVSYVLIAFVAISLIVSSIMISIITYISVLERTKEIGILRAIGASKKDVRRVFIAETIIEGAIAGILGIAVALCLSNLINVILVAGFKFESIAKLPLTSAITLIFLSIILNVIAGYKPASMAAKKDPVEALRTE